MACPHCGGEMTVTADLHGRVVVCPHCGKGLTVPGSQVPPAARPVAGTAPRPGPPMHVKNYLVEAILTTIFCCQPFGIVAIVYAAQVDGKAASGDSAGARYCAEKASNWCTAAALCGLAWVFVAVIVFLSRVLH